MHWYCVVSGSVGEMMEEVQTVAELLRRVSIAILNREGYSYHHYSQEELQRLAGHHGHKADELTRIIVAHLVV